VAQISDGLVHEALALRNLPDVTLNRCCFSASFLHGRGDFVSASLVGSVAQRYIGAFRRQALRNRAPNPLIAASDGSYFAFQSVCHAALLSIGSPMRCTARGFLHTGLYALGER
jgi:hypothetical protein